MATLYEHYETGADYYQGWTSADYWEAQTFTPSVSHIITEVELSLARWQYNDYDPGLITVSIRNTVSNLPSGGDLCSGTVAGSTLPKKDVGYSWIPISLGAGTTLTAGTTYAIVIRAAFDQGTNAIYWEQKNSGTYSGGRWCQSTNSGVNWTGYARDCYFREYGNPAYPEKPINPTPEHEGSGIGLNDTTASWEDGGGATSYNIYYGTLSGFLSLVAEGVTDLEQVLLPTPFDHYGEIYYWRVDAVNEAGTTEGDEWSFTTLIFDPMLPTGITLVDGEPTGTPTGENNMITVKRLVAAANNKIWYEDI